MTVMTLTMKPSERFRRTCGEQASLLSHRCELTPMSAIEEVDHQANRQPDEEGHPGEHFQPHHQQNAEKDAEDGDHRSERGTEATMPVGLAMPQYQHPNRDKDECEQGSDIR